MTGKRLGRREFLRLMAGAAAGGALAACTPQVVKETVIVEKPVKETVVVEKPVEKVVKETVVVEATRAPSKEKVTLTWAWWGSIAHVKGAMAKVRPFLERYPHAEVAPMYMASDEYDTKIMTMFAGGSAPDVIMVKAQFAPDWYHRGLAVQLDPLLEADPNADRTDWLESLLPYATVDGKLYGLPYSAGPMIWQYNTELAAASGVPTPLEYYERGEWTYDTVIDWSIANTRAEDNIYAWDAWYNEDLWMPLAWSNGGEFFNDDETECLVDSGPWVDAIQYVVDLRYKYEVLPPPGGSKEMGLNFRAGNIAAMGSYPQQPYWRAISMGGYQAVQPCYVAAGSLGPKCLFKSDSHCTSTQTQDVELSYELTKALCGPEGERINQEVMGYIFPATRQNFEDPEYKAMAFWDQDIQFISNEEHGHLVPITRKIPWAEMKAIWRQYTDEAWVQKISPAECCASIAADINTLLKESA